MSIRLYGSLVKTTYVPFAGFQNTLWSEAIDDELERLKLRKCDVNMIKIMEDICRRYCFLLGRDIEERLEMKRGDGLIELWATEGPAIAPLDRFEAHFERLMTTLSLPVILRIFKDTKLHILRRTVHERFVHSQAETFVSADVDVWQEKRVIDWEPEQLFTLLLAWMESKGKTSYEVEDFICLHMKTKGEIANIVEKRIVSEGQI